MVGGTVRIEPVNVKSGTVTCLLSTFSISFGSWKPAQEA
jgi:hypothetical protein